jgi:hypothetical protein
MELVTSTSAEQFQQCAEFLPFRNRPLGFDSDAKLITPFEIFATTASMQGWTANL